MGENGVISYSESLRESCDAHAFITQLVIFSFFFFPQKIKDVGILRPINHILRTQNKSLTERCLLRKAPFKRLLFPPFPANQFALLVTW